MWLRWPQDVRTIKPAKIQTWHHDDREQESLIAERGKEERLAASISDQMYHECQDLLRLFGIPWVVSPSEAEAQCAFMDQAGLR